MSQLASHHNVCNTCLNLLRRKGFELWIHRDGKEVDLEDCLWMAAKGDFKFLAGNPIELLGLAAIHEAINPTNDAPYWWKVEDEDIYQELVDKAYPDAEADE